MDRACVVELADKPNAVRSLCKEYARVALVVSGGPDAAQESSKYDVLRTLAGGFWNSTVELIESKVERGRVIALGIEIGMNDDLGQLYNSDTKAGEGNAMQHDTHPSPASPCHPLDLHCTLSHKTGQEISKPHHI